ncbi:hypothetical protein BHE74_00025875 [Ensete ventricosum]|nr:hypothetical protein GW17_00027584 [Ensete ventricosum]RWW66741.1 hypothetical protein BHE74_00025875 [Ensete ventricosum]
MASSQPRLRAQPSRLSRGTLRRLPSPHRSVVISPSRSSIPSLYISVPQTRPCTRVRSSPANEPEEDPNGKALQDEEVKDLGVRVALSMLKFYKSKRVRGLYLDAIFGVAPDLIPPGGLVKKSHLRSTKVSLIELRVSMNGDVRVCAVPNH